MDCPPLIAPGPPLTGGQVSRYSRHLLMPALGELGQRRLLAARVAVVGAGGLGSPSLLYLAAAGVGTITVLDDDRVDETNLQRQVIHDSDAVGRPKVDSAVERVRALNPEVRIIGRTDHLDAANARELLEDHDLVLDGSDNFETRYAVNDACVALGIPLVWAAVYRTEAHLTVFWSAAPHGQVATDLRDLFPTPPEPGTVPACGDAGVLGPLVGQVGSMMAAEAIKLITGTGEPLLGRVLFIDVLRAAQREIPLAPRADRVRRARVAPTVDPAAGAEPSTTAMISAADLRSRLDSGGSPPFVLDVREAHELTDGRVPGAAHLPIGTLTGDAGSSAGLPRDRDLVLVCRAGPRAHLAATALRSRGFDRLLVLDGGMLAWPGPIELPTDRSGDPTNGAPLSPSPQESA
ncbi:ThiF family adenylyltransferase [Janibacter sp. GS2]|uniref:ThiF family adenylyltransferase n=1 Tax=Janibacter sp. GS2 TaxID=3442646 RepID=UPI003EBE632B